MYEYTMAQHRDKGGVISGNVGRSVLQKLQEAEDEYDNVARLCIPGKITQGGTTP